MTFFLLKGPTVWSSELDTLLMRYEVNLTPYRIKSASNSLDQTVCVPFHLAYFMRVEPLHCRTVRTCLELDRTITYIAFLWEYYLKFLA